MATRIIVNGACGRMGQLLVKLTHADPGLALAAAVEAAGHPDLGRDAGEVAACGGKTGVKVSADALPEADVLIDFSAPEATVRRAKEAAGMGTAVLVGTTGVAAEQKAEIEQLADRAAVLISPNMSVGVNVLVDLVRRCAALMGEDFDIEIVEAHHRLKKDAPSGTAKRLLEAACEGRDWDPDEVAVYGREGIVGQRPDKQIGVMAVRGGDVVGEHTVMFIGMGEKVELTHLARSRDIFAQGAIRVAKFLAGKPAGLYTMQDALGL